MRDERAKAGLSTTALAERVRALATRGGLDMKLTQQSISKFEQGESKRLPLWFRYAVDALSRDDVSIDMLPDLPVADIAADAADSGIAEELGGRVDDLEGRADDLESQLETERRQRLDLEARLRDIESRVGY